MISLFLISKYTFIFIVTLFFIKILILYAEKLKLIDIPNHRSAHKSITPRGAGIGMLGAIILSDIIWINEIVYTHILTFLATFLVFSVGVLDDHHDTTPKTKFYVIFIAVFLITLDNIKIGSLGFLFGSEIQLGLAALPFTMLAVAGFTNALNLSDGLDGLAGLLSIVILSALFTIGYRNGDIFITSTAISFITAICAFLWFNWNPAKIFMGDSGSLTIGFVISVLSIKASAYIQPTSILFLTAIPIFDTLIVMIRRKRNGLSIFSPDKLHMHHILLRFFNGNVRKTVILMTLLQFAFSMVGLSFADYTQQRYIVLLFFINLAIFYILLNGMLDKQNKFSLYRKKRSKKRH